MELGKRYVVFSIRKTHNNQAAVWVRAGYAEANRDGSATVTLDVLPLDGKLHIREAAEMREFAGAARPQPAQLPQPQQQQQHQTGTQSLQLVEMQSIGGH